MAFLQIGVVIYTILSVAIPVPLFSFRPELTHYKQSLISYDDFRAPSFQYVHTISFKAVNGKVTHRLYDERLTGGLLCGNICCPKLGRERSHQQAINRLSIP